MKVDVAWAFAPRLSRWELPLVAQCRAITCRFVGRSVADGRSGLRSGQRGLLLRGPTPLAVVVHQPPGLSRASDPRFQAPITLAQSPRGAGYPPVAVGVSVRRPGYPCSRCPYGALCWGLVAVVRQPADFTERIPVGLLLPPAASPVTGRGACCRTVVARLTTPAGCHPCGPAASLVAQCRAITALRYTSSRVADHEGLLEGSRHALTP